MASKPLQGDQASSRVEWAHVSIIFPKWKFGNLKKRLKITGKKEEERVIFLFFVVVRVPTSRLKQENTK